MPNCSASCWQRAGSFISSSIISAVVRPVSSSPGLSKSVLLRCHSSLTSFCSCSKERRVSRVKVHRRSPFSWVNSPARARASADFPLPFVPTNAQLSPARRVNSGSDKVRVSLRRNVPCEICNDDMCYPIFCSKRCQGYSVLTGLSMRLAQCGDNYPVCIEICGHHSTFV